MKLNRKWINEEFVDLHEVSDKEFVETLTVFGQKVETWERMDAEIKNVVVGKVVSIVRHPNSDHMFICQVDVGQAEPVQIVTGAQNVHEGDLVPAALHNSYLPGGAKKLGIAIKPAYFMISFAWLIIRWEKMPILLLV